MKQMIVGILMYGVMTSMIHASSYDLDSSIKACAVLRKIIRERSLKDFKNKLEMVQQLHYNYLTELEKQCVTHLIALDVICEMRANPQVVCELDKIAHGHDEPISCLQMIVNFFFPNTARERAREISDQTYKTPLGYAILDIKSEFISLSDEDLYKKVVVDKLKFEEIDYILKQEQNNRKRSTPGISEKNSE